MDNKFLREVFSDKGLSNLGRLVKIEKQLVREEWDEIDKKGMEADLIDNNALPEPCPSDEELSRMGFK